MQTRDRIKEIHKNRNMTIGRIKRTKKESKKAGLMEKLKKIESDLRFRGEKFDEADFSKARSDKLSKAGGDGKKTASAPDNDVSQGSGEGRTEKSESV